MPTPLHLFGLVVMENLSSHNRKALVGRFGEKIGGLLWGCFTVHYTLRRSRGHHSTRRLHGQPPGVWRNAHHR
jgi:hypothetical protein